MRKTIAQPPLRRSERILKQQPKEPKVTPYRRMSSRLGKSERDQVPVTTLQKFKKGHNAAALRSRVKQIKTEQEPKFLQIKRSDSCTLCLESEGEIPRSVEVGPHTFQITAVDVSNEADQVGPYADASQIHGIDSLGIHCEIITTENGHTFAQFPPGSPFFLTTQFRAQNPPANNPPNPPPNPLPNPKPNPPPNSPPHSPQNSPSIQSPISPPIHSPISSPINSPISPPTVQANSHQIHSPTHFPQNNAEQNPYGLPPQPNFTSPPYNCRLQVEQLNPLLIKNGQLVRSGIFRINFGLSQIQTVSEITFGSITDNYIFESTFSPRYSNFSNNAFNSFVNNQQAQQNCYQSTSTTIVRHRNLSEPNQVFESEQDMDAADEMDEVIDLTQNGDSPSSNPETRFSGYQHNPPRPQTPHPSRNASSDNRDITSSIYGQFGYFQIPNLPRSYTPHPSGGVAVENRNHIFSMDALSYPTNCYALQPRYSENNLPRSHTPHPFPSNADNSFAMGRPFPSQYSVGLSAHVAGAGFIGPYQHFSGAPPYPSEPTASSYYNDIPCTSRAAFHQSNNRDPRVHSSNPNYIKLFQRFERPNLSFANGEDDIDLPLNLERRSPRDSDMPNLDTSQRMQSNFMRPVDIRNLQEQPNLIENEIDKSFKPQSQIVYQKHFNRYGPGVIIKYGEEILENKDVDIFLAKRKHILGIKQPLIIKEIVETEK